MADENVYGDLNSGDVRQLKDITSPLIHALNLLGYMPRFTFLKRSSMGEYYEHNLDNVEANDLSLSVKELEADVLIAIQYYRTQYGDPIHINIEDFTLTMDGDQEIRFEELTDSSSGVEYHLLRFKLGNNLVLNTSEAKSALKNLSDHVLYEYFMPKLMLRWYEQLPDYARPDASLIESRKTETSGGVGTNESHAYLDSLLSNIDIATKDYDPNEVNNQPGMLWILNSTFWSLSPEVTKKTGEEIWERMLIGSFCELFDALSSERSSKYFLQLHEYFLGESPEMQERFYEELKGYEAELGKEAYAAFTDLSYFAQILVLVVKGVVQIPELGGVIYELEETEEPERLSDFICIGTEEYVSEVELYVLGRGALSLRVVHPVYSPDTGASYDGRASFCWEMIENREGGKHNLIIVAAPGVSISNTESIEGVCDVFIYRVQDHALVPEWFTPINIGILSSSYSIGEMPTGARLDQSKLPTTETGSDGNDSLGGVDGEDVSVGMLYGNKEEVENEGAEPETLLGDSSKIPAFNIKWNESGDGVEITNPSINAFGPSTTGTNYHFKMNITLTDKKASTQKFSFYIEEKNKEYQTVYPQSVSYRQNLYQQYTLVVHYCGDVEVKVEETDPAVTTRPYYTSYENESERMDGLQDPRQPCGWVDYKVYQVKRNFSEAADTKHGLGLEPINAIPSPGHPLIFHHFHNYTTADKNVSTEETLNPNPILKDVDEIDKPYDLSWETAVRLGGSAMHLFGTNYPNFEIINYDRIYENHNLEDAGLNALLEFQPIRYKGKGLSLLMMIGLDIAVGFIPIAGDVIDILEVVNVCYTGRDRWGQPVTDFQFKLMVGAACLPFVSAGIAKSVKAVD